MSNAPTSPDRWSALLLLGVAIFGPPSIAVLKFTQAITQNSWLTAGLILLYEAIVLLVSILSGVWQQLRESWVKQIAAAIDSAVQNALSRYYHHYRAYFCYEHRDLDLRGMSTQGEYTLDLEDVLVELRIDPKPAYKASPDPLRLPEKLRTESQTIWDYLRAKPLRGQHLAILGAPGSGKTTLLRHIGLTMLRYRHMRRPKGLTRKLPVLLFIRDHSTAIKDNPHYDLNDAIRNHTLKWQHKMPLNWIERRLKRGHCLVLLDGLDEVADPETRQYIVKWVREQLVAYGRNRFILTSRPFGYSSNPISGLNVLEVQPFTWEQITQFVEHWYLTNEIKSAIRNDPGVRMKSQESASDLLRRLRGNAAIFALSPNPLLLTMIATVHRYRGSLPGSRVTLYKEICEVFLGKRREIQGVKQDLRADQRQLILQELAYQMMEREQRDIIKKHAEEIINPVLQEVSTTLSPHEFLRGIEQDCGLLLEREQGLYAFAHKTFQEYLAAVHIREKSLEQELTTHIESDWWHETIRLYCAQANASTIISDCLKKEPPSVLALTLALECLEEARNIQKEVKQYLDKIIEQGIEDTDPERRRVVAEALLTRRLRQMRPMNEQTEADTTLLTCVEYQLFIDEQLAQGNHFQPDHWRKATFPSGQGRWPTLGIRYSDAKAYCSWLTARDTSLWRYRLPYSGELGSNTIESTSIEETGYWTEEDDHSRIVWLAGRPPQYINVQIERAYTLANDLAFERALKSTRGGALEHNLANARDRALTYFSSHDLDFDLASTRSNNLNLFFNSSVYLASSRGNAIALVNAIRIAINRNLSNERSSALDRARELALDLAIAFAEDLAFASVNELARDRTLIHDLTFARDLALDLYFTLFLLWKRISGKLPPYEGILLIRELQDKDETT
jgi:NACHT domain